MLPNVRLVVGVQDLLAQDVPYWPLWFDSAVSAISTRIRDADGPVDPSRARFDFSICSVRWSMIASGEDRVVLASRWRNV